MRDLKVEKKIDERTELPDDFVRDFMSSLKKDFCSKQGSSKYVRLLPKVVPMCQQWKRLFYESLNTPKETLKLGQLVDSEISATRGLIVTKIHLGGHFVSLGSIWTCEFQFVELTEHLIMNPKNTPATRYRMKAKGDPGWRDVYTIIDKPKLAVFCIKEVVHTTSDNTIAGFLNKSGTKILPVSSRSYLIYDTITMATSRLESILKTKPGDIVSFTYAECTIENIFYDTDHANNTPLWVNPNRPKPGQMLAVKKSGYKTRCMSGFSKPSVPVASITVKNSLVLKGDYLVILEKGFPLCLVEGIYKTHVHLTCSDFTSSPWFVKDLSAVMFVQFNSFDKARKFQKKKRKEFVDIFNKFRPGDHFLITSEFTYPDPPKTTKIPQKYHILRRIEEVKTPVQSISFLNPSSDKNDVQYQKTLRYYYSVNDYVEQDKIVDIVVSDEINEDMTFTRPTAVKEGELVYLKMYGYETPWLTVDRLYSGGIVCNNMYYDYSYVTITSISKVAIAEGEDTDHAKLALSMKEEKKKKTNEKRKQAEETKKKIKDQLNPSVKGTEVKKRKKS